MTRKQAFETLTGILFLLGLLGLVGCQGVNPAGPAAAPVADQDIVPGAAPDNGPSLAPTPGTVAPPSQALFVFSRDKWWLMNRANYSWVDCGALAASPFFQKAPLAGGQAIWQGAGLTASWYRADINNITFVSKDRYWCVRATDNAWTTAGRFADLPADNVWKKAPKVGGQYPWEGAGITAGWMQTDLGWLCLVSQNKYWNLRVSDLTWQACGEFSALPAGHIWAKAPLVGGQKPWEGQGITAGVYYPDVKILSVFSGSRVWNLRLADSAWILGTHFADLPAANCWRIAPRVAGQLPYEGAGVTAALYQYPAASPAPAISTVKVMSFNIFFGDEIKNGRADSRWGNRKHLVFDVLRDQGPDVVGLQEAIWFQVADILAARPEFAAVNFAPGAGGIGHQTILYRKDRFTVEETGMIWLNAPQPGKPWGKSHRTCTWARFREVATGRSFYHYNTHLRHDSEDVRVRSARRILNECILPRSRQDLAYVLTGDMNAGPNTPSIALFNQHMQDSWAVIHGVGSNGTVPDFDGYSRSTRIDYVMASRTPRIKVLAADIIRYCPNGHWPSDHAPVTAVLELPR